MIELHPEFSTKDGKKEFVVFPYEEREFDEMEKIVKMLASRRPLYRLQAIALA